MLKKGELSEVGFIYNREEILNKLALKNGEEVIVNLLAEECSELIRSLLKVYFRKDKSKEEIEGLYSELADVHITFNQLLLTDNIDNERLSKKIDEKLLRAKKRVLDKDNKVKIISFNDYASHSSDKGSILVGKGNGEVVRISEDIDNIVDKGIKCILTSSISVLTINSSFFDGMFGRAVLKLGSVEKFLEVFDISRLPNHLRRMIIREIEYTLKKR